LISNVNGVLTTENGIKGKKYLVLVNRMKKISWMLVLSSLCYAGSAQTAISFRGYLRSGCDLTIRELTDYTLTRGSFAYSWNQDHPVAVLRETGDYLLSSPELAVAGDSVVIHIGPGANVDTLKQKEMRDVVFVDVKPPGKMDQGGGWLCCNQACEGFHADHYDNGRLRMKGRFRHGKAIGKLTFFDYQGRLNYIEYHDQRGKLIRSERPQKM
jgi:hypothetical protein